MNKTIAKDRSIFKVMNLDLLCANLGIISICERDYNQNAPQWAITNANHYRVKLTHNKKTMSFWFYQGIGIKQPPFTADLVENFISNLYFATLSFDDFVSELGLTFNTLREFKQIQKDYNLTIRQNKRFIAVIGEENIQKLTDFIEG